LDPINKPLTRYPEEIAGGSMLRTMQASDESDSLSFFKEYLILTGMEILAVIDR
jgi:hypothetical protein